MTKRTLYTSRLSILRSYPCISWCLSFRWRPLHCNREPLFTKRSHVLSWNIAKFHSHNMWFDNTITLKFDERLPKFWVTQWLSYAISTLRTFVRSNQRRISSQWIKESGLWGCHLSACWPQWCHYRDLQSYVMARHLPITTRRGWTAQPKNFTNWAPSQYKDRLSHV